jgi:hypothetical protein
MQFGVMVLDVMTFGIRAIRKTFDITALSIMIQIMHPWISLCFVAMKPIVLHVIMPSVVVLKVMAPSYEFGLVW